MEKLVLLSDKACKLIKEIRNTPNDLKNAPQKEQMEMRLHVLIEAIRQEIRSKRLLQLSYNV